MGACPLQCIYDVGFIGVQQFVIYFLHPLKIVSGKCLAEPLLGNIRRSYQQLTGKFLDERVETDPCIPTRIKGGFENEFCATKSSKIRSCFIFRLLQDSTEDQDRLVRTALTSERSQSCEQVLSRDR